MADLLEGQWEYARPFLEVRAGRAWGPWGDARRVLNGVLWILRTGTPWKDLPSRYVLSFSAQFGVFFAPNGVT